MSATTTAARIAGYEPGPAIAWTIAAGLIGACLALLVTVVVLLTPAPVDVPAVVAEHGHGRSVVWQPGSPSCQATAGGPARGCFDPTTPDVVYVSPDLTGATLEYVLLHELAHAEQHDAGRPLDECEADRLAIARGADAAEAYYLGRCPE